MPSTSLAALTMCGSNFLSVATVLSEATSKRTSSVRGGISSYVDSAINETRGNMIMSYIQLNNMNDKTWQIGISGWSNGVERVFGVWMLVFIFMHQDKAVSVIINTRHANTVLQLSGHQMRPMKQSGYPTIPNTGLTGIQEHLHEENWGCFL